MITWITICIAIAAAMTTAMLTWVALRSLKESETGNDCVDPQEPRWICTECRCITTDCRIILRHISEGHEIAMLSHWQPRASLVSGGRHCSFQERLMYIDDPGSTEQLDVISAVMAARECSLN